jgi:hypothetical protein
MKHEAQSKSIDWDAVQSDPVTMMDRYTKQYAEWREKTLLEMCAAIVKENPEATEFFFYDQADIVNSRFTITLSVPDANGIHVVPEVVPTVTRVDLVGYKKLVEEGIIKI